MELPPFGCGPSLLLSPGDFVAGGCSPTMTAIFRFNRECEMNRPPKPRLICRICRFFTLYRAMMVVHPPGSPDEIHEETGD
ncbi:hypothetical protein [Martelella mediterranea]|uniref:hypothetical protein n=1 Tax=Martelella mediterranea TaxID=293089 RepID=UPI0012BAAA45|nr:hypothetical protein [Martelella mediterranea]